MKRELMEITEHHLVAKDTYRMILKGAMADEAVQPGQFVHIRISSDHYLRRPVSICDIDPQNGTMTLLYKVLGKGTEALTEKKAGGQLDVLGPGGKGFPVDEVECKHALLIGGGIGVPPLYNLARQLRDKDIHVTSILGFQSLSDAFLIKEFGALGDVFVTTDDGTLGHQGRVTDLLADLQGTFDMYFTCGPTVMLKAVSDELPDVPGYISMEERMGCGIGACFACVVESHDEKGYRRICCDGPVFDSREVVLK
ncbi:dihydroorotate dehydrogenase electron transfer subunit [Halobacillus litoralis]|uniref:Dihydroorotate dehydrogenase B (NAD(+)), electron transfer subunit n=1 Tax=Halobacillus litoralis TaxID=45668 RepID=A0A410M8N7_9BACI|nr:dihydroorotate dehydrogenase electron transfer subunit [Halobacillus litoralis]QAS51071.1 dihydroorotate dehydrogenase electron transfer subunit [Halobacillus litoralis]